MGIVHQQGGHAAVDVQLAASGLIQHAGDDLSIRAEAAQQAGGLAALGGGDNSGSPNIVGSGAGSVAHSSADGQAAVLTAGVVNQGIKVGVGLGSLGDGGHSLQGLDGILACSGLARQHDRAGAVINSVGNVGDLGTGGARVHDHGIQHLGSGNADLTSAHGTVDQVLLDGGDLGEVDLNAHIAAGNHDAVSHSQDLVDVINALLVLDLGDDADVAVVLVQQVANFHDVLGVAHEAGRDQIEALLDTEQNIVAVAVAHVGHGQVHTGDVDTLLSLDGAIVLDGADDVGVAHFVDTQLDQTVVQHDTAASGNVAGQLFVGDRADLVGALDLAGSQGELLAGNQLLYAVLEGAQADLRAFGIQHGSNWQVQLFAQGAQGVKTPLVLLVITVGKVETGNVHAILHQLAQNTWLFGRRAHRTDNFCFTHIS